MRKQNLKLPNKIILKNRVSSEPIYSFLSLLADMRWHIYWGITIICLASSNYLFCKKEKISQFHISKSFYHISESILLKMQWDLEKQSPVGEHVTDSPGCSQGLTFSSEGRHTKTTFLTQPEQTLSQPPYLGGRWVANKTKQNKKPLKPKNPYQVYFYQSVNGFW